MSNSHQHESHLPPFSIRPRFRVVLPLTPEQILKRIRRGLKAEDAKCNGKAVHGFATLRIPEKDRHYWSPQLTVMVEESEEGEGSLVRGLYGPAPSVWTMFVFFYSAIGFAILVVTVVGTSHWSLGQPATILWWVPVLLVILLSLYLVSFFGQKLGHDQMETLHTFLEDCLGREVVEPH